MKLCTVRLRRGDSLENLAEHYGVSPQQIAAWNGVPWDGLAINQWVLTTGGIRLPDVPSAPNPFEPGLGWPVFSDNSRILLPEGGARPCVSSSSSPGAGQQKGGGLGGLLLAGLGLYLLSSSSE